MSADHAVSRRQFLHAGLAIGSAALATQVSSSAVGRVVQRPCFGRLSEIEHIVILMQENRSFDEFFGTFPGVRGFDDTRNRQAFAQPGYHGRGSRHGHLLPFHMDGRTPLGQCFGDEVATDARLGAAAPQLERRPQQPLLQVARDPPLGRPARGQRHGLLRAAGHSLLLGARRRSSPCATCTSARSSARPSPTGCTRSRPRIDPEGTHGGPNVATFDNGQFMVGDYRWTTMAEQLQARGISWKNYTSPIAGQLLNAFATFRRIRPDPTLAALRDHADISE